MDDVVVQFGDKWYWRNDGETFGPYDSRLEARSQGEQVTPCQYCLEFFTRFKCGAGVHLECDCPRCQGMCECNCSED